MPDNTQRFTGRATIYDRYRQRYPTHEILSRLREWCGLTPDWLIADIGAGTGMLAEVFLENGNRVIAIEPNPDMREQMRPSIEQHLRRPVPQLEIVDASAEATTLPPASIDLIAVGRAFHWFDEERAIAEFRRILSPTGWAIAAADRDRDCTDPAYRDQIAAYEELISTHGIDYARVVRSGYRGYEKMNAMFDGQLHHERLPGHRQLDWTTFSGHTKSLSVTPQPTHPGYKAFEQALRQYFDRYAEEGILTMPTTCWINAGRFRANAL
jgi:ubiquinone/menaquinone biosynthesis C-methylase UbiE